MWKRINTILLLIPTLCLGQSVYYARPAAGGGGPTTLFTDNFDRADSASLGANWTEGTGGGDIAGNKLRMGNAGASPSIVVTAAAAHADTADVKVVVTHASTSLDGGPVARCTDTDTTPTMYAVNVFPNEIFIYRHNNSATGTAIANTTQTLAANGIIEFQVTGTGATVTLKVWYNGSLKIDTTDTDANRLTTAGRPGVYNWLNGGTTTKEYDNFEVWTAP